MHVCRIAGGERGCDVDYGVLRGGQEIQKGGEEGVCFFGGGKGAVRRIM